MTASARHDLRKRLTHRPFPLVLLIVGLLVTALAVVLVTRAATSESGQSARPELQRILDGVVSGSARLAPGASAYVSGPKGGWLGSAGVADTASDEPMGPDARLRLESVSKIYTATLILQLAQEGKLRVGDTVEKWLPGLFPYGERMTIQRLLTMRSGLIDNNDLRRPAAASHYLANVKDAKLRAQILATAKRLDKDPSIEFSPMLWIRFAAWQPLLYQPGTQHYSNIGYDVLGLIAEKASGMAYPALLSQRIFRPLGLKATAWDPQGPVSGPHAHGYGIDANGRQTADASDWHAGVGAEGGIVSNAKETATFLTALMQGELLNRRQLETMKGANFWEGGGGSVCDEAYGWSGGGDGYKSEVWVNGDGGRVAVLLLNGRRWGDAAAAGDQAAHVALASLYCTA